MIERTHGLSRWTIGLVLLTSLYWALVAPIAPDPASLQFDARYVGAFVAPAIASAGTTIVFLVWLYRAVSNARALGAQVKWGPGTSVVAYVVPVVSLVLPYFVVRDLLRASDPAPLEEAPMFRERSDASYRNGGREPLRPPRWDHPAPILAWCIFANAQGLANFVFGRSVGPWISSATAIGAGILSALVVRSIDARQREKCRRLEAADERARAT